MTSVPVASVLIRGRTVPLVLPSHYAQNNYYDKQDEYQNHEKNYSMTISLKLATDFFAKIGWDTNERKVYWQLSALRQPAVWASVSLQNIFSPRLVSITVLL